MTRVERGPDAPLVISCKATRRITEVVERAVREHPTAFKDKSDFVRKAIMHLLRDLGYITSNRARRLQVDAQSNSNSIDEPIEETFCVDGSER